MTPLFPCKQYNAYIYTLHWNIFNTRWLELMRGCGLKFDIFLAYTLKYLIHRKLKFHIVQESFSVNFIYEYKMKLAWWGYMSKCEIHLYSLSCFSISPMINTGLLHGELNTFQLSKIKCHKIIQFYN